MTTATTSDLPLPKPFINFLNENGLDPSIYTACDSLPRYIRLKPRYEDQVKEIEAEIGCELSEVSWLPNFYSLEPDVQIASSKAYREGKIYGIDASSGAAVMALGISPGDHVLDLCAAPGAKLCMILDLLGGTGSATGVDVARHRLEACRTMIQKYDLGDRCRLFVADGATFSLVPISHRSTSKEGELILEENLDSYREWTSRRPWKERKHAAKVRGNKSVQFFLLSVTPELIYYGRHSGVIGCSRNELFQVVADRDFSSNGYDKVLVDAECTHDGSIKHVQKFEHWGWETLQRRVLDADRTDSLIDLQLQLLRNGFRLLKIGGSLIYSTCSLTVAQNEDVVLKFLSDNKLAELQQIEAARNWPCKSGRIPNTLRFDPVTSKTSGLFVAKFTKLPIKHDC
ncbi:rRNA (cytosine-C(5))-methyltransferase NOP2C-like protein [Drosera capensis]